MSFDFNQVFACQVLIDPFGITLTYKGKQMFMKIKTFSNEKMREKSSNSISKTPVQIQLSISV